MTKKIVCVFIALMLILGAFCNVCRADLIDPYKDYRPLKTANMKRDYTKPALIAGGVILAVAGVGIAIAANKKSKKEEGTN